MPKTFSEDFAITSTLYILVPLPPNCATASSVYASLPPALSSWISHTFSVGKKAWGISWKISSTGSNSSVFHILMVPSLDCEQK